MDQQNGTGLFQRHLRKVGFSYTGTPTVDNSGRQTTFTDQIELKGNLSQMKELLASLPKGYSGSFTGEIILSVPSAGKFNFVPFIISLFGLVIIFGVVMVFLQPEQDAFSSPF